MTDTNASGNVKIDYTTDPTTAEPTTSDTATAPATIRVTIHEQQQILKTTYDWRRHAHSRELTIL